MDIDELSTQYQRLRTDLAQAYAQPVWDSDQIDGLTDAIADTESALAASGKADAICYPRRANDGMPVAHPSEQEGAMMNDANLVVDAVAADQRAGGNDTNSGDAWQRRFGVPWERVERAVRAVSDRAIAASRRKFEELNSTPPSSEVQPG